MTRTPEGPHGSERRPELQQPDVGDGPDAYEGAADDRVLVDGPEDAAVGGVAPVVSHHEDLVLRDGLARQVVGGDAVDEIRLRDALPVDVHGAGTRLDGLARKAD